MAKIGIPDNILTSLQAGFSGKKAEQKKEATKSKRVFGSVLDEARQAGYTHPVSDVPFTEAELAELLEAVHSTGDELKKDATPANIINYKKAVRDFIHQVVERSYDVCENTSGRNILKRKKYTSISVIDEKLERLAADIMMAQRDKLDILARLDEIYGLLVDLLR
ncbi:MAG: YaaR family protein [Spirochaetes bacterium]|nr:YaaR family protein [Spirochaetota bacterium]MBU0954273.1 YaaR family protein [Spirochaetota bacterium]